MCCNNVVLHQSDVSIFQDHLVPLDRKVLKVKLVHQAVREVQEIQGHPEALVMKVCIKNHLVKI